MRIFVRESKLEYEVDKVKKTSSGWTIYYNKTARLEIRSMAYSGKLPPQRFWPWHKHHLHLFYINDFLYKVVFDETLLYEIAEEKYPLNIKDALAEGRALQQKIEAKWRIEDDTIKQKLAEYVEHFPIRNDLDVDVKKLEFLMRGYFRFHYFAGCRDEEYSKRLSLMFVIAQIVDLFLKRHVRTDNEPWTAIDHRLRTLIKPFPEYRIKAEDYEKACKDNGKIQALDNYYEFCELLGKYLPDCQDELLLRYLNYVCQDFLYKFHDDFAEFHWNRSKNLRGEFIFSEEQDYKSLYTLLKLHDFTSFILPEKIAKEDKQTVVNQYLFFSFLLFLN